jgi:hypothetical protein
MPIKMCMMAIGRKITRKDKENIPMPTATPM